MNILRFEARNLNQAGVKISQSELGDERQIVFELPFTETDLSQIEKIPPQQISPNLHISESNLQIKLGDIRQRKPHRVEVSGH